MAADAGEGQLDRDESQAVLRRGQIRKLLADGLRKSGVPVMPGEHAHLVL